MVFYFWSNPIYRWLRSSIFSYILIFYSG